MIRFNSTFNMDFKLPFSATLAAKINLRGYYLNTLLV